MEQGKVYLVGAGPGDPGLITVKGAERIEKADVILFDRLVNPALLQNRKKTCELVRAGKSPSREALGQEEINRLLIEKAREGKTVVRLKGGDPYLFGRGGEEALALAEAGIDFEVVPGVTAVIAAAAYAGIPVTHRELSSTLTIATGHEDPAKTEGMVDWSKIASVGGTAAVYMGVKRLAEITDGLTKGGMPPDTPAAVIQEGTSPSQKTVVGTVSTIAALAAKTGITPPALSIFGEVVNLREKLKWFEKLPLFGKTIVITRATEQAEEMIRRLTELGAEAVLLPTIKILPLEDWRPVDDAIENLRRFVWIIFTSVNGVEAFLDRLLAVGRDARALHGIRLCAIGPVTAERLKKYYLKVDCQPEEYTSKEIIFALEKSGGVRAKCFLLPRADIATPELPDALRALGGCVSDVAVYRTVKGIDDSMAVLMYEELLKTGKAAYITFTSSSTARNFASYFTAEQLRDIAAKSRIASIGPATSAMLREIALPPHLEAKEHTVSGLIDAILSDSSDLSDKS
jgi:uroporphyrinogen III methyltransferase/synthase